MHGVWRPIEHYLTIVRSMAHNEDIYPDSYAFKPERFLAADGTLDPNIPDPAKIVFGVRRPSLTRRPDIS